MGQEHVWEIDTKFVIGWLSKFADSEAFRENNIYPKGVRGRGLLTTVRQGFRSILRNVRVAIFRLG